MARKAMIIALLTVGLVVLPTSGMAQTDDGVSISSPFPGVSVEPGDSARFDLDVESSDVSRTLSLEVSGLPDGWDASLTGGGAEITRVTAGPDSSARVRLDVSVPADASEGSYEFTVTARGEGVAATTTLEVDVRAGAGGDVTLTPDFPGLRGPADATFTFTVEVRNDTPREVQLELAARGPSGWRVEARPTTERQASTISIDSGSTQRVNVEARPPVSVQAGTYEVTFGVSGSGIEREIPLTVQVVGDVALDLSTTDQRLNATVTAGQPTEIPLVVVNTGTAPLVGVELSGTPPRNWEVSFEPEVISELAPGQSATVTAVLTPSSDAIAGDYRVTLRASVDQAQDSVEIRTTVNPSAVWGLVGVAVIALTLGGLAAVFRRYGRR